VPLAAAEAALRQIFGQCDRAGYWRSAGQPVLSAVSGGPDSLALVLCVHALADSLALDHRAVIIDHGLRAHSAAEAREVAARLSAVGISNEIRKIAAAAPASGIQEWARQQRLGLLAEMARSSGAVVLFAHHHDDQAETVAFRLLRQSGLVGLRGIAALRFFQGALFARPFLGLCKTDLIAICRSFGVDFVTDPSNSNPAFTRVRMRRLLQAEPGLGRQLTRLAALSARLTGWRDSQLALWTGQHAELFARLSARIPAEVFFSQSEHVCTAILSSLLRYCGPASGFSPSDAALSRLLHRLSDHRAVTIAGCYISRKAGYIDIQAEYGRQPPEPLFLAAGGTGFFDQRWLVRTVEGARILRFGQLAPAIYPPKQDWPRHFARLPARLKAMIPVARTLDGRALVPHLMTSDEFLRLSSCSDKTGSTGQFIIAPAPVEGPLAHSMMRAEE